METDENQKQTEESKQMRRHRIYNYLFLKGTGKKCIRNDEKLEVVMEGEGHSMLFLKLPPNAQYWDQLHREVDFNKVVLFCFCFYYGADVYVMSKKKLFVNKFLQYDRYHWVYYL